MKIILQRVWAVLEVIVVVFGVVPLLTLCIYRLFPAFEAWQTQSLGFPFPVFVYLIMITVSLLIPLLRRKKLIDSRA